MKTMVDLTAPIAATLRRVIETFDKEVRSDLPFVNQLLDRVRVYRGKLLRPKLLLLSGSATGELRQRHIVLAAVVELIHMATLVHDDVLDEADIRRHNPTVNRICGNEGAVLLGDYLISHSYHLCSSLGSTHASRRIAAVTNTVCEGELMQIEHRGDFELDEATYLEIIRRKTATLTSVCCELGAAMSRAESEVVEHMAAFGMDLGIAFQIVDDLLDLTATESEMGKTIGRDTELGKLTLPLIRFLDQASPQQRRRLLAILSDNEANRNISQDPRGAGVSPVSSLLGRRDHKGFHQESYTSSGAGSKTSQVRSLLAGSDAIDYAMGTARSYIQSAVAHLSDLPAGEAKDTLIATAEFVLERRQ